MTQQLRGVNLGGWLVLERWITPSLFAGTDAIDEYMFMRTNGAAEKLDYHRRTFVAEADFEWMASHGISAVRIPVGYWLFDGDDGHEPHIKYLDWAVKMAKKYKLRVLIDMHAAPGSQNGQDHSGRVGRAQWYRDKANRTTTIDILVRIAEHYKHEKAVWGIELLNEPRPLGYWKLRKFYRQAYRRIIEVGRPGLTVVYHDAFMPRLMSGVVKPVDEFPVVMDVHWYHFLDWWHKYRSVEKYFRRVWRRKGLIDKLQKHQPVIVGEWSLVIADQTLQRQHRAKSSRYMKQHAKVQIGAYMDAGWFYWTYKTEEQGVWNFRYMVEKQGGVLVPGDWE